MVETPHKTINMYPKWDNFMHFRRKEINWIKIYFITEIHERETMSTTLSKYVLVFEYVDKA